MRSANGLLAAAALALVSAGAGGQPTTIPSANLSSPPAPTLPDIQPVKEAKPIELLPPPGQPAPPGIAKLPSTLPSTMPSEAAAPIAPAVPAGQLKSVVVRSNTEEVRDIIAPSLGATTYTVGPDQIQQLPQGEDAPFQQVLLRAPSVVMDSFGQEHVRGEHANLTYRINGVLLPEGQAEFGQELDTHLVDSVTLIDGSLPAQFGLHTAGIVDVTTKSGESLDHNEISLYGGGYNTFEPSIVFGGTSGKLDYFFSGSYRHDSNGIENPTSSFRPIHDDSDQYKGFSYLTYHLDDTSSLSLILNGSYSNFQIPNTPGLAPAFNLAGVPFADSSNLDENQNEQDYYQVISYQKTMDKLALQASLFNRYSQLHFTPDDTGDLIFQGVASDVFNSFYTTGGQFDASYILNDQHTLRGGMITEYESERLDTNSLTFPADPTTGAQTSDVPIQIGDSSGNIAFTNGVYLQDEWRIAHDLTINYGGRFDQFNSSFDRENQFSPRINVVYKIGDKTTTHIGYSRYFTPPPLQNQTQASVEKFANTTNAPANFTADPSKVEKADYFDAGISRQITDPWQMNLDGFYKYAHNLVDLGQFGQAFILSPFNYRVGTVYGADVSTTYKQDGFSAFGNFAYIMTNARDIVSQQFQFDNDELAYIQDHDIHLDHDSELTASAGVSYEWKDNSVYLDILYGSGLRTGFANLGVEPQYYPVNVGYEHTFHPNGPSKDAIKLRFDVVNLFDESYQLRSGTGVGVNASQYGQRRTVLLGLTYDF